MDKMVRRIFVEKKTGMDIEAKGILDDLRSNLGINELTNLRLLNRYDVEGITSEEYEAAKRLVFSEPNADNVFDENIVIPKNTRNFSQEFLPGQYDQRADSAAQCVQILTQKERPLIRNARIYILEGQITDKEFEKIKKYLINPVESREASSIKPETLEMDSIIPENVSIIKNFTKMSDQNISDLCTEMGLAMSSKDLAFCRDYFRDNEKRDPYITEIKVIDTYWSDHCRHTTFLTRLNNIKFENCEIISNAYEEYIDARKYVYGTRQKDVCLMDIATIAAKYLKKKGILTQLDESEEINACSIKVKANIDGNEEDWLVMFKNETHNHPTEIEPFGGAATCLGGAIRDPLSGRSYVYQAMRVTGSADPTVPFDQTLHGKLSQRKITTGAASGYSSYGNQIGLATGQVTELYHPGYMAKRMEIGAVIAAVPANNVVRTEPNEGDIIILLGGRTGRDGIGGATGSSKEHTDESVKKCGSEVQKGNAPTERKIQRLFRNPDVSTMIKRCNDFGAGGVCVAIGELAPSLVINLDAVPKKYEGLDGTEIAISESQERMAVVINAKNEAKFIEYAKEENLEAVKVAVVENNGRLKMVWRDNTIVNLSREFLDTNGVKQDSDVTVSDINIDKLFEKSKPPENITKKWFNVMADLNSCSQKGLSERFDSTIGANTVLMPFGGKYQLTPEEGMAAKLPVLKGTTKTATLLTYGFDPYLTEISPFHGASYAIVDSIAKITAMGGNYKNVHLTFQEYFERLGTDPYKWGKPMSALLGAFYTQKKLGIAAIGGKDSMSGTFMDIHVPPTLVSFAVDVVDVANILSAEFKRAGSKVILYNMPIKKDGMPDFESLMINYSRITQLIAEGKVISAMAVKNGGICETISKMTFGNKIGFEFDRETDISRLFEKMYGSIILEVVPTCDENKLNELDFVLLGYTCDEPVIKISNEIIDIDELIKTWSNTLSNVFPHTAKATNEKAYLNLYDNKTKISYVQKNNVAIAKPRVFIPVFPGTNCEYDTARAFNDAGAIAKTFIFKNLDTRDIEQSIQIMKNEINQSQIIMIPGGFSGGDEPDGSGKFIATAFRNEYIKEAVMDLLKNRDGLMLGICNGFQALIKLGLVPYGEIRDLDETDPTLTFNTIGRHISRMVETKVVSTLSPWLWNTNVGDIHTVPISHGEGRFLASPEIINKLIANNQIATQYADALGNITMDPSWNPNGSINAIEGITSPDGRVFGKMAHSERAGSNVCVNIPGEKDQKIFKSGVEYFTK